MERVKQILEFWFGNASSPQKWFVADPDFDRECREGFGLDYERAARGELDQWAESPEGALALVLLLDQFPRNIYRGTARAFASDDKARVIARHAVAAKFDHALPPVRRAFLYMPFQHSESLSDQHESVRLFRELASDSADAAGFVQYAERHLELISRFGRFPYRNAVLGRQSTPDELQFLAGGGS
jgi:uncharacterized protein (DUF924 family)